MSKNDSDLIERVSSASKISLTEAEKKKFSKDLKNILDAFSSIDALDTKGIKPAFQPIDIKDRYREDKIESSLSQNDSLKNTKNKREGYFVGPKAI